MVPRTKIAIRTVGCRANQADSGTLARSLDRSVLELVDEMSGADVVVINTCCVTAQAERDCRKMARRALRESPGCKVILTGCAVSAVDGFGADIDGDVLLLGGGDTPFVDLAATINGMAPTRLSDGAPGIEAAFTGGRTRALLKVQNGCEHGCSYCIVPRARGPERSMPMDEALEEVDRIASDGIGEIVLTGVQIGAWGGDIPGRPGLATLVERIADRFIGGRVRLSSVEPWSVDEALIDVIAGHERVCPHLHVPMQSGRDRILAEMRRGYDAADFASRIEMARRRIDGLAFGTDVICGFPGEDEAAFENTLNLLQRLRPAYLHAFSYSPRPGTRAFDMVSPGREVAKERAHRAIELGDSMTAAFRDRLLGTTRQIIVEDPELGRGLTDNFVQVEIEGCDLEAGVLADATFHGLSPDGNPMGRPVP